MQAAQGIHEQQPPQHASVLAGISLLIGSAMALAIVAAMLGGKVHGWKSSVAMLIISAVPICSLSTALAIISLIWRKENKNIAQISLWLNGMLAFFAFPIMVYWLLAMQ